MALLFCSTLPFAARAGARDIAEQLRDRALVDSGAWEILESLVTEIGPRPTGSPAMTRARDWAVTMLRARGFEDVHIEPFVKENAWLRGAESASLTSPVARTLTIAGLGNGVPTPPEGIEAEIAVFPSLDDLISAAPGSMRGKIAIVNEPMVRTQSNEGYRAAVRVRRDGPSLAAARGAIAFLTRSISTSDSPLPHAGATKYVDGIRQIPAAALGVPDADLVSRLAARGAPVRLRLLLSSTVIPRAPAWNVVGEITGSTAPDEVIVIGGHLDSWDLSEGATDDGAGIAITASAAALIGALPRHPRRTIRVVLWGSEETGGSGAAYAEAHRGELGRIILASECDFGTGRVYRVTLPAGVAAAPRWTSIATVLAPLKVFVSPDAADFAGSDVEDLHKAGVPIVGFSQDATHYFDVHHSADDTLQHVDRGALNQNVAAWAALIYLFAGSDSDVRALSPAVTSQPAH